MTNDLCKRYDVFFGYGAMDVVKEPEGKDQEYKANPCRMCDRHRIQIVASQKPQRGGEI